MALKDWKKEIDGSHQITYRNKNDYNQVVIVIDAGSFTKTDWKIMIYGQNSKRVKSKQEGLRIARKYMRSH